jgi:hypothetical protein
MKTARVREEFTHGGFETSKSPVTGIRLVAREHHEASRPVREHGMRCAMGHTRRERRR